MARTVIVNDFRRGLDTRRSILTSVPGAMVALENCHVNQGGEIDKRQQFVAATNPFPSGTFGLEVTAVGLVTFGSIAAPSPLPAGVTYVRLTHPTGYDATGVAAMTSVPCSANFNGKAFVITTWSDGNVFLYFDGALIQESRGGLVLYKAAGVVETVDSLATDLAALINSFPGWKAQANMTAGIQDFVIGRLRNTNVAILVLLGTTTIKAGDQIQVIGVGGVGYNGIQTVTQVDNTIPTNPNVYYNNPGSNEDVVIVYGGSIINLSATTATNGSIIVDSPPGVYSIPVNYPFSSAGVLSESLLNQDNISVGAAAAYVVLGFTLSTTGTLAITAPAKADGSGSVDVLGGTMNVTNLYAYDIFDMARKINARTGLTGYSCVPWRWNGGSVSPGLTIFAPASFGLFTYNLTVTTAGTLVSSTTGNTPYLGLQLTLTPSSISATNLLKLANQVIAHTVVAKATASATGNNGVVSYAWIECDAAGNSTSPSGIILSVSNRAVVGFSALVAYNSSLTGFFKCTATDGSGSTSKILPVKLFR